MPNDPLQSTLADLRRQLRDAVASRLGWQAAAAFGAAFWIALLVDRWLEPSPTARGVAWAVGLVGAAVWAFRTAAPRLLAEVTDQQLATLVSRNTPGAADSVTAAVELAEAGETGPLAAATRRAANARLAETGTPRVVRPPQATAAAWFATFALASALLLTLAQPSTVAHFAKRLALSPEPWPRRVRLMAEGFRTDPGTGRLHRKVVLGEPYELTVTADLDDGRVAPRSVWARRRTEQGWRRAEALTRVGAADDGRQPYRLRVAEASGVVELRVSGGDCRLPPLWVEATARPTVTGLRIECQPPAYLGAPPSTTPASAARPVPEGASLVIHAEASKPIAEAHATLIAAGQPDRSFEAEVGAPGGGVAFRLPAMRRSSRLLVRLIDTDGIRSDPPYELPIDVTPDGPPTVELRLAGVGRVATRDALARLVAPVNDDHGVDSVRLTVKKLSGVEENRETPATVELVTPFTKDLPADEMLEADLLALRSADGEERLRVEPGDRLELQAGVVDRYDLAPREPSRSEPVTIDIVTPDELMAVVGQRESELRRTLEGVLADTRRLAYAIDLRRRRETTDADAATRPANWGAERLLETRKARRGVEAVAGSVEELAAEVLNSRIDQPALVDRLLGEVAQPLAKVAAGPLSRLAEGLDAQTIAMRSASDEAADAVGAIEAVVERLEARETYNEAVAMLRGLIREQRRVNDRTTREQRAEARRLLLD